VLSYLHVHQNLYPLKFGWNIGFQIETQKIAIPFGAFIIVQEIYWYGDTLMLSYLKDMQAVGYYNAAYRLLEGMIVFPNLICQAVLPHLSRLYQADSSAHNRLSITLQKICVAVAVFLSGASFILAPLVIEWVFGEAYLHAIGIFEILSLGFFFVFTNIYFLNLLVSIDGQKLLWKLSCGGLIFNLVLNAFVIPIWGAEGAAATTVLSEVLVLMIGLFLLADKLPVRDFVMPLLKAITIGAVILLICEFSGVGLNLWLSVLLYCALMVPVIYVSGLLSPRDIQDFARTR
ncbi:MAG: polysaccharide biosynthesis C-terminal domain-containing protein, partial [Ketobacter sp.]